MLPRPAQLQYASRRFEHRSRARWWLQSVLLIALAFGFAFAPGTAAAASLPAGIPTGLDISWPQCVSGIPAPSPGDTITIIGVTGGRAFTRNPCFVSELGWATSLGRVPAFYVNVNYPSGPSVGRGDAGPAGKCAPGDAACRAFNYGYNTATDAVGYAQSVGASAPIWWLDVETMNHWSPDTGLNAQVIQGALRYFQSAGLAVGIYSVAPMWRAIAGSFAPGVPIWVARTSVRVPVLAYCGPAYTFAGGAAALVQSWNGLYDVDYGCPGGSLPIGASDGSAQRPFTLGTAAQGTLQPSPGGASAYYTFAASSTAFQTLTISFGPRGPDVANGIFVTLYQNGKELAKVRGVDTPTPGTLKIRFSPPDAGSVVVQITAYGPAAGSSEVSYSLGRTSP
jgi:hypothetical protein